MITKEQAKATLRALAARKDLGIDALLELLEELAVKAAASGFSLKEIRA